MTGFHKESVGQGKDLLFHLNHPTFEANKPCIGGGLCKANKPRISINLLLRISCTFSSLLGTSKATNISYVAITVITDTVPCLPSAHHHQGTTQRPSIRSFNSWRFLLCPSHACPVPFLSPPAF